MCVCVLVCINKCVGCIAKARGQLVESVLTSYNGGPKTGTPLEGKNHLLQVILLASTIDTP